MKSAKYLLCLTALAFAACATAPEAKKAPEKAPQPAATVSPAPAVAVLPAKTLPKQNPTLAPKKETPKKEEPKPVEAPKAQPPAVTPSPTPAVVPVKKDVVVPPPPPTGPSGSFRCAYWVKPADAPVLYVKQNGEYKHLDLFEMAFPHSYDVEFPVVLYVKNGNKYEVFTTIDNYGLKDFAAILLPSFYPLPDQVASGVHVISMDDSNAPGGTLIIHNWMDEPIAGKLSFKQNAQNTESLQSFALAYGESCTSYPVAGRRQVCNIEIVQGKDKQVIFSSGISVYGDGNTTHLLILQDPDSEVPIFKTFRIKRD